MTPKKTLFSGIMPSGSLHIGNYLGAIKDWVDLQKSFPMFVMIADLHAITVPQDTKTLYEKTFEVAALLIACGIDIKKSTLFVQSQVPAHTELSWILNTITPLGELERMTQYKDKKKQTGSLAGLLYYPILQAADILLYKPTTVPVGEDQFQHIEFTRMIAKKFNERFGNTFILPMSKTFDSDTKRILGLDDPSKKMSKSAPNRGNYIALLDSPDEIRRKVKSAVTDSKETIRFDWRERPAITNLINIYQAFSKRPYAEIEKEYYNRYAEFKKVLADCIIAYLEPIQKEYHKLRKDRKELSHILTEGKNKAETIANKTLWDVKEKVGLVLPG